jgi:hypothetical protein
MRDGRWKLVRPAIGELMKVTNDDMAMDVDSKYNPQNYTGIVNSPEPEREKPQPPSPQLFDLINDPFERVNLAAAHPERVSRMTNELAAWFEDVELERMSAHL